LSRFVNLVNISLNINAADPLKGAINVSACNEVIKQLHYNYTISVNCISVLINHNYK
jgi:hypothetical protein